MDELGLGLPSENYWILQPEKGVGQLGLPSNTVLLGAFAYGSGFPCLGRTVALPWTTQENQSLL